MMRLTEVDVCMCRNLVVPCFSAERTAVGRIKAAEGGHLITVTAAKLTAILIFTTTIRPR